MSPFHYCAAIYHTHGQGDFVGTYVCVCVENVAQAKLNWCQGTRLGMGVPEPWETSVLDTSPI